VKWQKAGMRRGTDDGSFGQTGDGRPEAAQGRGWMAGAPVEWETDGERPARG